MWLVVRGRLGPFVDRGWPTRRQGSEDSRLVTVGGNARSSPSSRPCIGRSNTSTTCGDLRGEPSHRENGLANNPEGSKVSARRLLKNEARSEVLRHAQASGW